MADDKNPLDSALDLFVYAPLGLALAIRDLLPQMAEKGRAKVTGQTQMAKMVGQFAVQMGQQEAEKRLRTVRTQAEEVVGTFLPPRTPAAPNGSAASGAHVQTSAPVSEAPVSAPGGPDVRVATADVPRTPEPAPAPATSSLAIPGYDTLSASQVVQRLSGLDADERAAVRAYETANRGRKTILNKLAQLDAE